MFYGTWMVVKSFNIKIYVGLRGGYSDVVHSPDLVTEYLQGFCDDLGFCFSISDTKFIYKDGNEPGVVITIINYPRFPKTKEELTDIAINVAEHLKILCNQQRVSIVCDDLTYMV